MNTLDILKDYVVAELSYTTGDDRIHINLTKKNGVEEYNGCITFGDKDELIFHGEYENYLKFNALIQKGLIIGTLAKNTKWEGERMEL